MTGISATAAMTSSAGHLERALARCIVQFVVGVLSARSPDLAVTSTISPVTSFFRLNAGIT